MGIEAWRKNEALDSFDVLKKGELITVEGYFKPEEWTDSKSGEKRNRIVMVATKFYPAPEKEEYCVNAKTQYSFPPSPSSE